MFLFIYIYVFRKVPVGGFACPVGSGCEQVRRPWGLSLLTTTNPHGQSRGMVLHVCVDVNR